VIQDTAQETLTSTLNAKALIVSIREYVVRHQLQGVHLDCAACMQTSKDNHRVNKLRFLNEIIDSARVNKPSGQIQMGHELPRHVQEY
jgi:hypothetical protein